MIYIYIIYSEKYDKYYVGHTEDINRRLFEHNNSPRNTFTSKYRPWIIKVAFPVSENRNNAMKVEKYIKKQKSRHFIENIITNIDNKDFIAQLVVPRKSGR